MTPLWRILYYRTAGGTSGVSASQGCHDWLKNVLLTARKNILEPSWRVEALLQTRARATNHSCLAPACMWAQEQKRLDTHTKRPTKIASCLFSVTTEHAKIEIGNLSYFLHACAAPIFEPICHNKHASVVSCRPSARHIQ